MHADQKGKRREQKRARDTERERETERGESEGGREREGVRGRGRICTHVRETALDLWLLFLCFFLPLGLPTKMGKPGLPEVLILVLGLSFVLFSWNSPFLVF